MLARRADIDVQYQGIDITPDIRKDLLEFSYSDNASGNADDISLSLKDDKKKWLNNWFTEKGDTIKASILTMNWRRDEDRQRLDCGRFIVDEPEYSGRPSIFTIRAISTPVNSNFTTTQKSKSWRNISLHAIGRDIASSAGLEFFFDSPSNPVFDIQEQTDLSDMNFLAELCGEEGIALKITDKKIVMFDEAEYEKRPVVGTFSESDDIITSYSFSSSLTNTAYAGCEVKYFDAENNRTVRFLYTVKEIEEGDKIFEHKVRAKNGAEAQRLARKKLRQLNKREFIVNLSFVGNVNLVGGACIQLNEFGSFSGKYFIEQANHIVGSAYSVDVQGRKVLSGY